MPNRKWMHVALAAPLITGLAGMALGRPDQPAPEPISPAALRFAAADGSEVPDFQRHVLPVMGQLGCNGRSCHGSFQGAGGFRLSLFGYDFKADHEALLAQDEDRVDTEIPAASLILEKPTLAQPHKGGKVLEPGSWQYHLIAKWVEAGAPEAARSAEFDRLEVTPAEITFDHDGQQAPLRVVAHWSDGTAEDVTCLARFRTNDDSIAEVDAAGVVTSKGRGDTHVIAFYDNGVAGTQVLRPVSDQSGDRYPPSVLASAPTQIDRLVGEKLRKLGIVPSEKCSDEEFLRRLSLDLTGTLPTPAEARAFAASTSPDKRAAKIDELLGRPEYAAYWTNRLCDITGNIPPLLRVAGGNNNPLNQKASALWYDWIYKRVAENRPYDQIIAGIVLADSREEGEDHDDFIRACASYFGGQPKAAEPEADGEGEAEEATKSPSPESFADRQGMPFYWARTNLRQPEEKALNFSYAFLGVRLECAQCHKHPFDQWTQQDFNQFKAFFDQIRYGQSPEGGKMARDLRAEIQERIKDDKRANLNRELDRELMGRLQTGEPVPFEELLVSRPRAPRPNQKAKDKAKVDGSQRVFGARVLGGDAVNLAKINDPREPLMDWMRSADNPYFARSWVNRVWAAYFGSGIINPPDDMNLANPPSNPALMDYLTREFVARGYDMKWLHREILASDAYQRSWRPNETNRLDDRNFSRAVIRRLPAETLLDAVAQSTANSEKLATFASDLDARAFGPGAAARYGRTGPTDFASKVFGRSTRETNCDCSRSEEPNLLQLIYLQNDTDIFRALDAKDGWVAEFAEATKPAGPSPEVAALQARVAELEKRVERARKVEKADKPLAKFEKQLREAREALREARPAAGKPVALADEQFKPIVEEAYLRTLGRSPSESDLAAARDYFGGSKTPADGLKGLLWALMNTKEFMTNH